MSKVEYISERLELSKEESTIINMGIAPDDIVDKINIRILEVINIKGKQGWEALYPFSVPVLWFKRTKAGKVIDKPRK